MAGTIASGIFLRLDGNFHHHPEKSGRLILQIALFPKRSLFAKRNCRLQDQRQTPPRVSGTAFANQGLSPEPTVKE
jgi:hypothetical protein